MKLAGWGRYPRIDCRLITARRSLDAEAAVCGASSLIARGHGRAYGDAALNRLGTLSMPAMDRFLAFDAASGLLTCEAGVTLGEIVEVFLPRGWFPSVTPGTRYVTVGGAIAADVHGKNHHRDGAFGNHVASLDLLVADGRIITCGPDREPDLFAATRGGMGLTGVILRADIRLRPVATAFIRQEMLVAHSLSEIMEHFEASSDWTYSVAWIDCLARGGRLGRSLLMRGEHATPEELPAPARRAPLVRPERRTVRVPLDFPGFALNRLTVSAFNELYFRHGRPGTKIVGAETFFYPLDAILDWNRIYGGNGFLQYQCVLPRIAGAAGLHCLLDAVAASGLGSFLAVLKLLGAEAGLLSFPMEGYTLALDFPATVASFNRLIEFDAIVADHGGRVYLAKDACMGAGMMRRTYPGLDRFRDIRATWDGRGIFQSLQSERLGL